MNVLGIGDQPYDELKPELKDSLNEYYKAVSYTHLQCRQVVVG